MNKSNVIMVLKTLQEYTDKEHYLTQKDIIKHIENNYDVTLNRKTIARAIATLEELDYDIVKRPNGGVAIASSIFDSSEIKFLMDAIFSSKSIPGKQAQDLCKKLSELISKYERHLYPYIDKTCDYNRTNNKNVFYNIEIINEAIKNNKWVGFKYLSYDENGNQVPRFAKDYETHASPCYLVNNYGRYYLLAYGNKYKTVTTWRVDNMIDVRIMEERDRVDPKTLTEFKNYSNISEYLNDHIYLFGGPVINAVIEVNEPKDLMYVYDWFGSNAELNIIEGKMRVNIKCNENAFFYWVMQYSEHIKVLSPESMKEKILKAAENIQKLYKED